MMSPKLMTSWRRFAYLLLWSIFTAILVVACSETNNLGSSQQPNKDCRVVQHTMGETCIPRNPQRVIAIKPNHFANTLALGIQPIASALYEGFPVSEVLKNKVDKIEFIGDLNNPSIEKILLLKPDLIISNYRLKSIYPQLSHIAPTIVLDVVFPPPSWKKQFEELAQILDKQETYQQLMAEYWQRIENLKQAIGDRYQNAEISFGATASGAGIRTYGAKHPVGEILNDLGLQRPPVQRGDFYFLENISEETLSDIDGDLLFLTTWGREEDKETRQKLSQQPLWQKLRVVRKKQVYFVDQYWVNPGNILAIKAILDDLEQYLLNSASDSRTNAEVRREGFKFNSSL